MRISESKFTRDCIRNRDRMSEEKMSVTASVEDLSLD
mgnify:CR=1 FL=1